MKYFRPIGYLDVAPVLERLRELRLEGARPDDIVVDGLRHKAVPLRLHENATLESFLEDLPVYDKPLLSDWPEMRALIADARRMIADDRLLGHVVDSDQLGRAVFSLIEPRGFVKWHIDPGEYVAATMRFHVPLVTSPGAVNRAPNGESLHMGVGELTWLDNKSLHGADNESDEWRTHLIFECRCRTT